jgi:hypothetical protein
MTKCFETSEMLSFLSSIDVAVTILADGILVHALTGDVLWFWTGTMWCWG